MCYSKAWDIFVVAVTTPVVAPLLLVQERKLEAQRMGLAQVYAGSKKRGMRRWDEKARLEGPEVSRPQPAGRPCRKCKGSGGQSLPPARSESSVVLEKVESRVSLGPPQHRSWVEGPGGHDADWGNDAEDKLTAAKGEETQGVNAKEQAETASRTHSFHLHCPRFTEGDWEQIRNLSKVTLTPCLLLTVDVPLDSEKCILLGVDSQTSVHTYLALNIL